MAIVAGVDFGTLSVRVSLVDSDRGLIGSALSEYPLHRKREDPDYATQSHDDHMRALASATRQAVKECRHFRRSGRGDRSRHHGIQRDSSRCGPQPRLTTTTCGAITAQNRKLPKLQNSRTRRIWRPSSGAAACTPPSGDSRSCCTGFGTIPTKRDEIRERLRALRHGCGHAVRNYRSRRTRSEASVRWATSGCGTLPSAGFLRKVFWSKVDPLLAGVRAKLDGEYATSDKIAGTLAPQWAEKLGLRAGIPIPVGAFDAHWDAIGAGAKEGDVVNVVGTSTCIIAYAKQAELIPGVCGVVKGSVHPQYTGVEAGLSATGDIFSAIAQRANTTVAELSKGLENYRAGQTGLLRMTWDNGDRTVLVNPNLGGITLGWNLQHTAQDELFAAIEGTAFHTRVILDRMSEYGAPTPRVINGGGIPQNNPVLNQVYANVLGRPVLVPSSKVTGIGSAIFAFLAAGTFKTIDEAQDRICSPFKVYEPEKSAQRVYADLYQHYRRLYFAFGEPGKSEFGQSATHFDSRPRKRPKKR